MLFHRIILVVFLVVLATGSCTIHKRVHSRGYHIEWRKRYHEPRAKCGEKSVEPVEDTLTIETVGEADTLVPSSDTLAAAPVYKPISDSIAEAPEKDTTGKKFEKVGVLSASMLFPAFLVALADDEADATYKYGRDFWLSVVLLAILALMLVLGIVSMIRYLRNPKAYRFNIWAIIGLLIPLVVFIALLAGAMAIF